MSAEDVVSAVGLWWPAADENNLRDAAAAWRRMAEALHAAGASGRLGAIEARARWSGEAADRFDEAWRDHEKLLADDEAGCLALESALLAYAEAVAEAEHKVEEIAVTAGVTIVAGVGLAWATFGVSAAAAGEVTAGLVAAAAAVGVELSSTVAAVTATALVGATFSAGEAAMVDVAAQAVRVWGFHDGGFSGAEVGDAASAGALTGGPIGGAVGYGAVRPMTRIAAGDLSTLRAPGGRIRAALDPTNWGPQGFAFRAGVHETPEVRFRPNEIGVARRLADEGNSVHVRAESNVENLPSPDAIVRASRSDAGRYVEFKQPRVDNDTAVKNEIRRSGQQLRPYGGGDLILDGRAVGLTEETARRGLNRALGEARAHGAALPDTVRIILNDHEIRYP